MKNLIVYTQKWKNARCILAHNPNNNDLIFQFKRLKTPGTITKDLVSNSNVVTVEVFRDILLVLTFTLSLTAGRALYYNLRTFFKNN